MEIETTRHLRVRNMTAGAFARRGFLSHLGVWQWMMTESEVAPSVRFAEPLTILDAQVDAVELAVEISSARRFLTRAVWKGWIENASQFFYQHRSFGKGTRLQIRV